MMKSTNYKGNGNLATGMKTAVMIIVGLIVVAIVLAALPVVLPILYVVVIAAGGFAVIIGAIYLLGAVINMFKGWRKK